MAASRRWALIYAFWQWFGCAPAGVGPLEVRFAHPVRLSPDTHSQGHGRPCLQRLHPRRAFPATWFIFCDSFRMSIWFRLKRFPRTKHVSKALPYRLKRFRGTKFRFYPTGKRDRKKTATSTGSPARIPNWNYTTLIPTAAESLVKTYQCQIFAGLGLGLLVIQLCHLEFHQNGITLDNIGEKRLCARTHQRTDIHVSLTDVTAYR